MKTYTAMIACLALVSAAAVNAGDDTMKTHTQMIDHASSNQTQAGLPSLNSDDIKGKLVLDSRGNELGDVDEVVVDKSNRRMVVIDLNDSSKEVLIPLDKLTMSADEETLSTTMTRAELEALPDYDDMDMESTEQ